MIKCRVCGEPECPEKDGRDIVYCAKCATPHHHDCWHYNKKCAIFGCEGTEFQSKAELPPPVVPPVSEYMKIMPWAAVLAAAGVGCRLILLFLAGVLASFQSCDGCSSESHLVYSPALNSVVCYRDETNCLNIHRPCTKITETAVTHEYPSGQKDYRISEAEFVYLHPYCNICNGRFSPTDPCVHLKWVLEAPTENVTETMSDKFCDGRFPDCFRTNRSCIKKVFGSDGSFLKVVELKQHPQCTVCGHWLVEGLCKNHHPNVVTSDRNSMNAFSLIRFQNK